MRHDTFASDADIRVEVALDTLHVAPDLFAYSLVRTATTIREGQGLPGIPASLAETERQGFVDGEGFRALRQGQPHADLPLVVATTGFLDAMRRGGFAWLEGEGFGPLEALRDRRPFEALRADPAASGRIVRVDTRAQALLDARGAPIPCALRFDAGTPTVLDDAHYDLESLAAALSVRGDVVALDEDGDQPDPPHADAARGIHAVPWEDQPRRAMSILWVPDAAAYAAAWAEAARIAGSHAPEDAAPHLHRAVVDLDILGIAGSRLDEAPGPRR